MDRLKKRFVVLFSLVGLIFFASFLAAQGPPNPCANACWQAYLNKVADCRGNPTCLANAREVARTCLGNCGFLPPR